MTDVVEIGERKQPEISEAANEEEAEEIWVEMQEEMVGAVEAQGMTVEQYNEITQQARWILTSRPRSTDRRARNRSRQPRLEAILRLVSWKRAHQNGSLPFWCASLFGPLTSNAKKSAPNRGNRFGALICF